MSWTQVDTFLRNPDRYVREYMLGERNDIRSPSLAFGSRMAKARELGDADGDEEIQTALSLVPQFKVREYEIRETLKTQDGAVDLLGKLDSFDPETLSFRDDKTGLTRWTQRRAQEHKQLRHYATLIYLKHGKAPREAWLDWIETEIGEDGVVHLTGHVESFRVLMTLGTVLEYMALVGKVAREIDAEYRKQLDKLT